MRWIRFTTEGKTRYGIVEGDRIQRVSGDPFDGYETENVFFNFDDIKIEIPVLPRTFYCAGLNYAAHVLEVARKNGVEPNLPKQADIGYRANNALIAHDEFVIIPADATEKVQYEGELVAVIGKKARNLSKDDALTCVLGYTIGNDVSERTWQGSDRTLWRAKNTDTFKPMGPWIDTEFQPALALTTVKVNGETTTTFRTAEMLFDVATFISKMSQYLTLYPGDVIWMGTDGSSPNLRANDVVEIEISGLGVLRNTFIKEQRT